MSRRALSLIAGLAVLGIAAALWAVDRGDQPAPAPPSAPEHASAPPTDSVEAGQPIVAELDDAYRSLLARYVGYEQRIGSILKTRASSASTARDLRQAAAELATISTEAERARAEAERAVLVLDALAVDSDDAAVTDDRARLYSTLAGNLEEVVRSAEGGRAGLGPQVTFRDIDLPEQGETADAGETSADQPQPAQPPPQQDAVGAAIREQESEGRSRVEVDAEMWLGERYSATLIVYRGRDANVIIDRFTDQTPEPTVIDQAIRITSQARASASSTELIVTPQSPDEWQTLSPDEASVWTWTVEPQGSGPAYLRIQLHQKIVIDGQERSVPVKHWPQTITVSVGWRTMLMRAAARTWNLAASSLSVLATIGGAVTFLVLVFGWWRGRRMRLYDRLVGRRQAERAADQPPPAAGDQPPTGAETGPSSPKSAA